MPKDWGDEAHKLTRKHEYATNIISKTGVKMKKNLINLNIKKLFYDISEVFDKINSSSTYILTSMNKPKKPCPMDFVFL